MLHSTPVRTRPVPVLNFAHFSASTGSIHTVLTSSSTPLRALAYLRFCAFAVMPRLECLAHAVRVFAIGIVLPLDLLDTAQLAIRWGCLEALSALHVHART